MTNNGLKIVGNDQFITQTKATLELLKDQVPSAFQKVQQYIGLIEQAEVSHMWAGEEPPRYAVNKIASFKD